MNFDECTHIIYESKMACVDLISSCVSTVELTMFELLLVFALSCTVDLGKFSPYTFIYPE